jgi:serine/threonine protein kinase
MTCVEKLGSGGFSDVYLYEREHPRGRVAVKLLKADVLDESQRRQFAAEADAMAELAEHPYIVPVLGAGTSADGRPYLVMRYYPPPDLGARVAQEPLDVTGVLRTGIQLASAVETAHRAGIIHRDIKPANVLISSYGVPGLSDFGIAGRGDRPEDDEHLGVSMPWSPPEVLSGQSNGSPASDVYSLAATIWNLLVGRSPFAVPGANDERALFSRILHSAPPATGRADVPASLERLLQQAMAKQPDHRPQTALELARHLQRVEQELRLARTEIVVLEAEPHAAAGSPSDTLDEPTMLKRPVTVRPAAAPATSAPPVASPSTLVSDEVTERRPARVTTAGSTSEMTERRPQRASDTSRAGTEDDGNNAVTARRGRLVALGAAAALVVGAVAVAVVLATSGNKTPSATLPSPPGPSSANDVLDASMPTVPQITATLRGHHAIFATDPAPAGTTYQWLLAPRGAASTPIVGSDGKHQIRVPADSSGTTCVQLKVVSHGQVAVGGACAR